MEDEEEANQRLIAQMI